MNADTVIIIPVLDRPARVEPLIESIEAATPERHRVLFVCSPADRLEHRAIDRAGAERLTIGVHPGVGDYSRKVNTAYRATTEPLLFLAADDLNFHPGWLTAASLCVRTGIGVIGTQDLGNPRVRAGRHSTHSLIVRTYIDQHGTIDQPGDVLCELYDHNFSDTELVQTAQSRKAWMFAAGSVVEHLHPHWNADVPMDDTYRRGQAGFRRDRQLFTQRRHLWGA